MKFPDLFNPYAYAMSLRRLLFKKQILKSEKISVPVISIGNLSMGGTGKTPVTLHIANYCIETLGIKTAIVLRGYKRESLGYLLVSDGKQFLETAKRSGDEAQIYAQELSESIVICDEDRVRGAKNAASLGAEIILLDDAFQHMRIRRDLNILLINSDEGIPAVMPFGKGREKESAIRDADIIIATNADGEKDVSFLAKPVVMAKTVIGHIAFYGKNMGNDISSDFFQRKKILAFCGIANPKRFKNLLDPLALSVILFPFKDHAEYDRSIVKEIIARAKSEHCDLIATTTKDAVKMLDYYKALLSEDSSLPPLAVIHTKIEFTGGEEFLLNKINDLFK